MTDVSTEAAAPVKKPRKPRAKSAPAARLQKMSADKFQKTLDAHAALGSLLKAEVVRRNTAKSFVYHADADG